MTALTLAPASRTPAAGPALTLRAVCAADAAAMDAFVRGLSADARRLRFHAPINGCTPSLLRLLTQVDAARGVALVAVQSLDDGDRIVGEARYTIDASGRAAEFAIAVADAWQGRGLAQQLMQALRAQARAAGLQSLYGSVLDGNARMQRFMEKLGFTAVWDERAEAGTTRFEQPIRRDLGETLAAVMQRAVARLAQARPARATASLSLVGKTLLGKTLVGKSSRMALSR